MRSTKRALIANKLTSPMLSNTSSGSLAASVAFIKNRMPRRSLPVVPGLKLSFALVKPKVIVALGATAAQALLGPQFRVTKERGKFTESTLAPYIMATVHPSSILRAPDDETR